MKRPDFEFGCECGYRICCGCGTPWYPMEVLPSDGDKGDYDYDCPDCGRELSPLLHGKLTSASFADEAAFSAALVIHNSGNGMGRNVAQYYLGNTWIMNAYECVGSIFSGIEVSYLIDYTTPDGMYLLPKREEGVEYDETCVFGEIPASDLPEKCKPFDCGYGGPWGLWTSDEPSAMKAAFKMWQRKMLAEERKQKEDEMKAGACETAGPTAPR